MTKKWTVILDPKYEYLRVDPVPSAEEVEEYYRQEFYSSSYAGFNDSSLAVQQDPVEQEFNLSRFKEIAGICGDRLGGLAGRRLLDIGCGYGEALLYFRDAGMDVLGVDPSPEAAEHATKQDIRVKTAGIENVGGMDEGKFDVVTLLNVLEHLRDPGAVLSDIRRHILKPGGILVIDVPNEFNAFQLAGQAEHSLGEWWVAPPAHINYFTADSLKGLLEQCGYDVLSRVASFPMEMFLLMGDKYVGNPEIGRECHIRRVKFEHTLRKWGKETELNRFYQALAALNLGRQIVAFAQEK